jgi:hypothetical protein
MTTYEEDERPKMKRMQNGGYIGRKKNYKDKVYFKGMDC